MIRALAFDFNGVLVNDEPLHLELFQRVLGEEGLELGAEEYYGSYLGFDDRGCFAAVLAAAGREVTPPRLARLIARKSSYYSAAIGRDGYPFYPGAVELVLEAAGKGIPLVLVSGALRGEIAGALRQAGIEGCFSAVVAAEDVERGKPDPEGYLLALAALNGEPPLPTRLIHPHECAAIEDSPAGIESAVAAGLRTVGVAQTYPAERLAAADAVVESLANLRLEELRTLFS